MIKSHNVSTILFQSISVVFKRITAQNCPLVMIEQWKKVADNGGVSGELLTDSSKAFEFIPRNLKLLNWNHIVFK